MPYSRQVRTLLVDDNPAFLNSAAQLLSNFPELQIVGQSISASEAFEKVELLRPDLVLMDMVMPGINGLEAAHIIKEREPATYVIIWTLYAEAQYSDAAEAAGADGLISKTNLSKQLLPLIHTLFQDRDRS